MEMTSREEHAVAEQIMHDCPPSFSSAATSLCIRYERTGRLQAKNGREQTLIRECLEQVRENGGESWAATDERLQNSL